MSKDKLLVHRDDDIAHHFPPESAPASGKEGEAGAPQQQKEEPKKETPES